MSKFWSLVRRHPFMTFLIGLFAIVGVADRSGDSFLGAVTIIVFVLFFGWLLEVAKRSVRKRRERRADSSSGSDESGDSIAQRSEQAVGPVQTESPHTEHPAFNQMPDVFQPRMARTQEDVSLRRSEEAMRTRQEEIERRAAALITPQHVTQMSPQQMARKTDSETLSPAGQSAFAETAQRSLPTTSTTTRSESTLTSIRDLLAMTPIEFEEFCVRALRGIGYTEVRRVGGPGDLSADIIALDNLGRSVVIQCKRYRLGTKVGSPALQTFIGMKAVHHEAERGIYMTTADYSIPAVRLAKQHDIVLIDGDDLVKIAGLVLVPKKSRPSGASVSGRYCGNCGAELDADSRFCTSCGAQRN